MGAESRRRMPVLFLTPHSSLASIRPRPLSQRASGAKQDCNCSAADHFPTTSRPHLSITTPVPTTVNSKGIWHCLAGRERRHGRFSRRSSCILGAAYDDGEGCDKDDRTA